MVTDVEGSVKPPSRRRKAEATRRKILRAAQEEFLATGFHGATMAAIATRAGVAVQTVYFVFHTKAELISAVIDAAVMGDDEPVSPQETGWWAEMEAAPSADEALRIFVRGAAPLFERASAISEILRAAALTDPDVRRTHERHARLQRDGFRQVVASLAQKGALRSELDSDTATDVLLTVFGDAVWHLLRSEHGWSEERVTAWMCDALPRLLLDPTGQPSRRPERAT